MVQKRPFGNVESYEVSSKHPRQLEYSNHLVSLLEFVHAKDEAQQPNISGCLEFIHCLISLWAYLNKTLFWGFLVYGFEAFFDSSFQRFKIESDLHNVLELFEDELSCQSLPASNGKFRDA